MSVVVRWVERFKASGARMKPQILHRLRRNFYEVHDEICRVTGRKHLPDDMRPRERDMRQVLVWLQREQARDRRGTKGGRRWERRRKDYKLWLRSLNVGDVVAACYDGKGSRKCRGVVVKRLGKGVVYVSFRQWASDDTAPKVVKFKRGAGWGNWYYSLKRWTNGDDIEQMQHEHVVSASEVVTQQLHAVLAEGAAT